MCESEPPGPESQKVQQFTGYCKLVTVNDKIDYSNS